MVALAPSDPRNGPVMLRPPSYAMSAKRLTMPMMRTNRKASFASCFELVFDISYGEQLHSVLSFRCGKAGGGRRLNMESREYRFKSTSHKRTKLTRAY